MASPRHLTMTENLPVEVLSDIFIRLLAKQLAQMRCVCKPWNALLSDSSFIKSHLHRSIHNNDEILLLFHHGFSFECSLFTARPTHSPDSKLTSSIKLLVKPKSKDGSGRIIGSVNGLICFYYVSNTLISFDYVVYIWNPSLSAVLTLPPCPLPANNLNEICLRFGYDPRTDDYKVVNLTTISGSPQAQVYSMRKGSWKLIPPHGFPFHVTWISRSDEVCVVGNAHWLCFTDPTFKSQAMVAFDLSAETFREIPIPDSILPHHSRFVVFGVSGGKVCVMFGVGDGECEVWVIDEFAWVKHHAFSQFSEYIIPYGFTSQGEFLFQVGVNDDRFALYDPIAAKTITFKTKGVSGVNKVVEYVDSLVWVAPAKRKTSCYNISQF